MSSFWMTTWGRGVKSISPLQLRQIAGYKTLKKKKKIEKGVLTLKTHRMLSVHTTPKKLKNATITSHHFQNAPF